MPKRCVFRRRKSPKNINLRPLISPKRFTNVLGALKCQKGAFFGAENRQKVRDILYRGESEWQDSGTRYWSSCEAGEVWRCLFPSSGLLFSSSFVLCGCLCSRKCPARTVSSCFYSWKCPAWTVSSWTSCGRLKMWVNGFTVLLLQELLWAQ